MLPEGKHSVQCQDGRRRRRGNEKTVGVENKRSLNFKCGYSCLTTCLNYVQLAASNVICRRKTISASQAVHCQKRFRHFYIQPRAEPTTRTNSIMAIGSTLEVGQTTVTTLESPITAA